jgi:hypothetical protein
MKTRSITVMAGLLALLSSGVAMAWEYGISYRSSYCYSPPVVVRERVYAPPVVRYEPRWVSESTYFDDDDDYYVAPTRSYVQYEPIVERPCYSRTVIVDRPRVVTRSYVVERPTYIVPNRPLISMNFGWGHGHSKHYVHRPSPHKSVKVKIKH